MSYELTRAQPLDAEVRRVVAEQLDEAMAGLRDSRDGEDEHALHDAVHEARKSCKRLRALARLVRGHFDGYSRENARYRDAARLLSDVRDTTAVIETYDDLIAEPFAAQIDDERSAAIREVLSQRRVELTEDLDVDERVTRFLGALQAGRAAVDEWTLDPDALEGSGWAAIAPGLAKTYRRAQRRMADAYDDPSTEAFHQWRKRTKYHRYHLELLMPMWPDVLDEREDACDDLGDLLGDDHDLAVLRGLIEQERHRFDDADARLLVGLLDHRRGELQARARPLGARLFAEDVDAFVERMGAYWEAWQEDRPSDLSAPIATAAG
ncbi:MAG TPA: CHAD domain-containing protein [Solirubrobacteraceae bacterium]|nr:CHAD domain-containing protein [Solirubrobacteraceae bacterium]